MKSWILTIAVVIVAGIITTIVLQSNRIDTLQKEIAISRNNVEVLLDESDSLRRTSNMLLLTVEQLNAYSDSTLRRMNELRNDGKLSRINLRSPIGYVMYSEWFKG